MLCYSYGLWFRKFIEFHDKHDKRIFGFDNAHAIKTGKKFTAKRVSYDHWHKSKSDKGTFYEFESAEKLLQDFFDNINRILKGDVL